MRIADSIAAAILYLTDYPSVPFANRASISLTTIRSSSKSWHNAPSVVFARQDSDEPSKMR